MNIGIDATCWWNNRGFGRFTRELLEAIFDLASEHHFYLFVDQPLPDFDARERISVVQVQTRRPVTEAAVADSSRSPLDMLNMGRAVSRAPIDVMFFPAVYSWFPVSPKIPALLTVHDAIAEHFPSLIFPNWRGRLFWSLKMKLAIANCARVLTVSNAAREEIVRYIGVSRDRIDVTSEAPGDGFEPVVDEERKRVARRSAGLPEEVPLVVYVGGLAPHKNLLGLLEGLDLALQNSDLDGLSLALIGDFRGAGFYSDVESLEQRVQASPRLRNRVYFTGYVSDEDLVALYSSALATAMPSFSEGFGLPAVEAMACGTPVLSSDRGSLPEVVGDGGIYFDPENWPDIAQAFTRLVNEQGLHGQLSARALARAGEFTWERAARSTLDYLEALAAA